MLSPYSFVDFNKKDEHFIDVYITKQGSNISQRVQFTDEEFEQFCEFMIDMFPSEKEEELYRFRVDSDHNYKIKII
jgi:hypothetical protein